MTQQSQLNVASTPAEKGAFTAESGAPGLPVPASHATVLGKRADVPVRRGLDRLPVYVTAEEARAIINATSGYRDRLLLETVWQTGGRISELLRLRPADVDPADGTIRLANLKRRRRAEAGPNRLLAGKRIRCRCAPPARPLALEPLW